MYEIFVYLLIAAGLMLVVYCFWDLRTAEIAYQQRRWLIYYVYADRSRDELIALCLQQRSFEQHCRELLFFRDPWKLYPASVGQAYLWAQYESLDKPADLP